MFVYCVCLCIWVIQAAIYTSKSDSNIKSVAIQIFYDPLEDFSKCQENPQKNNFLFSTEKTTMDHKNVINLLCCMFGPEFICTVD